MDHPLVIRTPPPFRRPSWLPEVVTDAELLDAVRAHLVGAERVALAIALHLPMGQLNQNLSSREWSDLVESQLPDIRSMMAGRLTRIATLSTERLEQALEEGEPMFNWEGQKIGMRPVRAKELINIASQALEQQRRLESLIGRFTDDDTRISLEKLAEGLKRYAEAKQIEGERLGA